MDSTDILRLVFSGVFGALLIASLVGSILQQRPHSEQSSAVIENLNSRIKSWWWMVGVLALACWGGSTCVIILFFLISFQSLREFISVTYTKVGDHGALLWCFYFFLPVQYWLISTEWYGLFSILIPVYAFLLLPIFATLASDANRFFERAAKIQWGLMICVYCISHLPALLVLDIPGFEGRNLQLIVFLVLVVQASDVFQYVWGKLLGRRKLSPEISPSKTLEGLVGGVLTSTLVGAFLWWMTPFNPWQATLIVLLVNLLGFFGGFVLSAIKRDQGLKDWGSIVSGHGGMIDRVDSISFAAPVFFHVIRYWWVP